jgi:quercetin dioxygenase-like cupin family protein
MVNETGFRMEVGLSAGEAATEVLTSGSVRIETIKLEGDAEIPWQRAQVSDRVLVVTGGRGYAYRAHHRDEVRDEISAGDLVYLKRLVWHRIVAAADEKLVGVLVTAPPHEIEYRR